MKSGKRNAMEEVSCYAYSLVVRSSGNLGWLMAFAALNGAGNAPRLQALGPRSCESRTSKSRRDQLGRDSRGVCRYRGELTSPMSYCGISFPHDPHRYLLDCWVVSHGADRCREEE